MGRIRTIKPEFFKNLKLFELEVETGLPLRLAFAGIWTVCDREGRFEWIPRQIKVDALPYDEVDFSRVLHALATRDFVRKYVVNGVEYGHVPAFADHQAINGKEKSSNLPIPNENNELYRVDDAWVTREQRVPQGKERKGKERNKGSSDYELGFSEPKQQDEIALALEAYKTIAVAAGCTDVRKLDAGRKKRIKDRLQDVGGLDGWREAMWKAAKSEFLTGKKTDWKANLDFFLEPSKFNKFLEGQYDNNGSSVQALPSQPDYQTPEEQLRLKWRDAADFKKANGRWPRNLDNPMELSECPQDILEAAA